MTFITDTPTTGLGDEFLTAVSGIAREGTKYTFETVAVDLYRDIHKGIRAELFAVTSAAGSVDPGDGTARGALADHVQSVGEVLAMHAAHEDAVIDPALQLHLPWLGAKVAADHESLEGRYAALTELALSVGGAVTDARRLCHLLYLELSAFTGSYLVHQLVEERMVMPALERAVGVDAVVAMHKAIVGSIAPEVMARSLAFMLPAMNLEDRCELLGGVRMTAPAEAFAGVVSLARSVLDAADFAAVAGRLALA